MKARIVTAILLLGALFGCSDGDEGIGTFYEFTFSDSVAGVIAGDSVKVVI